METVEYQILEPGPLSPLDYKEPSEAEPSNLEIVAVMFNPIGESLEHTQWTRGQVLANALGDRSRVIIMERPLSGSRYKFDRLAAQEFSANPESVLGPNAEQLDKIMTRDLPGSYNRLMVSHSLGASHAIGVMAAGLEMNGAVLTEPHGIRRYQLGAWAAIPQLVGYTLAELPPSIVTKLLTGHHKPTPYQFEKGKKVEDLHPGIVDIVIKSIADIQRHAGLSSSGYVDECLIKILEEQPDMNLSMTFPDKSFSGGPKMLEPFFKQLRAIDEAADTNRLFLKTIPGLHGHLNSCEVTADLTIDALGEFGWLEPTIEQTTSPTSAQ